MGLLSGSRGGGGRREQQERGEKGWKGGNGGKLQLPLCDRDRDRDRGTPGSATTLCFDAHPQGCTEPREVPIWAVWIPGSPLGLIPWNDGASGTSLGTGSSFGALLYKVSPKFPPWLKGVVLEQFWVCTVSPFSVSPKCCHSPSPRSPLTPHFPSHVEETFLGMEFVPLCFYPSRPRSVPRGRAGIWFGLCFLGEMLRWPVLEWWRCRSCGILSDPLEGRAVSPISQRGN